MSDTSQGTPPSAEHPVGGHAHRHGKPSSWVLVTIIIAAFMIGGIAVIVQNWWLFWVSTGAVVLSVPAGWLIRIMDDTVIVDGYPDDRPPAADRGSAADPGVLIEYADSWPALHPGDGNQAT